MEDVPCHTVTKGDAMKRRSKAKRFRDLQFKEDEPLDVAPEDAPIPITVDHWNPEEAAQQDLPIPVPADFAQLNKEVKTDLDKAWARVHKAEKERDTAQRHLKDERAYHNLTIQERDNLEKEWTKVKDALAKVIEERNSLLEEPLANELEETKELLHDAREERDQAASAWEQCRKVLTNVREERDDLKQELEETRKVLKNLAEGQFPNQYSRGIT